MKPSTKLHWKNQVEHSIAITHDDPYGSMDLKAIAAMLNESSDNFSHKFAAIYGETFVAYNKRRRVEAGAGELRHSGYTIADIAERCGYTLSSFSRAFRELYNESPTSFRDRRFLTNEENTMTRTKIITSPHHDPNRLIFCPDRAIDIKLPDSVLYYNILPGQSDPIQELMYFHNLYHAVAGDQNFIVYKRCEGYSGYAGCSSGNSISQDENVPGNPGTEVISLQCGSSSDSAQLPAAFQVIYEEYDWWQLQEISDANELCRSRRTYVPVYQ